ncbi:hypothetical protein, partial [Candidatus Chloroploca sp. Khr17]|uniref:hypothetical protein n=1 Tax=Candidatus Chloroploca sp. Khr17 TaxID=2496869 RepID=UPI0013EDC4D0
MNTFGLNPSLRWSLLPLDGRQGILWSSLRGKRRRRMAMLGSREHLGQAVPGWWWAHARQPAGRTAQIHPNT